MGTGAMRVGRAACLAVALVAAAACGDDDGGSNESTAASSTPSTTEATSTTDATTTTTEATTTTTEAPPRQAMMQVRLVDGTRPTIGADGSELAPTRTLPTTIHLPREGDGPFPLVVHAHGNFGSPEKFERLLAHWAEQGFVVAAPRFPLTSDRTNPTVIADYPNQPADMSFVIDEVLAMDRDPDSPLYGLVDEKTIGASGLSLGAITVHALGFHSCCLDERVDAIQMLAGSRIGFPEGEYVDGSIPLLIAHGTSDPIFPYETARQSYDLATSPVLLATLHGGGHADPFEVPEERHDEVGRAVTTQFWKAYLLDDEQAERRLTETPDPELLTIERR